MELAPQLGVLGKAPFARRLGSGGSIIMGGHEQRPNSSSWAFHQAAVQGKGVRSLHPLLPKTRARPALKKGF